MVCHCRSIDFEDGETVLQLKARVAKARGYDDSEDVIRRVTIAKRVELTYCLFRPLRIPRKV